MTADASAAKFILVAGSEPKCALWQLPTVAALFSLGGEGWGAVEVDALAIADADDGEAAMLELLAAELAAPEALELEVEAKRGCELLEVGEACEVSAGANVRPPLEVAAAAASEGNCWSDG